MAAFCAAAARGAIPPLDMRSSGAQADASAKANLAVDLLERKTSDRESLSRAEGRFAAARSAALDRLSRSEKETSQEVDGTLCRAGAAS
jgi:hypothetical protein